MAYPTVRGTPAEGAGASATTTTVTFAQNTGDRVVIFLANDATARTWSLGDSFVNLTNTSATFHIFTKVLDGSEGGNMVATASVATKTAWIAYNITTGTHDSAVTPAFSTVATGTSTAPNAGSLTPAGGSMEYLWLTAFGQAGEEADDDTWVTGTPTSFSGLLQKATGTSGAVTVNCQMASAQYAYTNSVLDAAAFTTAQSLAWRAYTVAITPIVATQKTGTAETGTGSEAASVVQQKSGSETAGGQDRAVPYSGEYASGSYRTKVLADGAAALYMLGSGTRLIGAAITDETGNHSGTWQSADSYAAPGLIPGQDGASDATMIYGGNMDMASGSWWTGTVSTIEAWVEISQNSTGYHFIAGARTGDDATDFYLLQKNGSQTFEARWSNDAVTIFDLNPVIPAGIHHVVLRVDGANLTFWLDGVQAASRSDLSGTFSPAVTNTRIANDPYGFGWLGRMQAVALYPSALSDANILNHARLGRPHAEMAGAAESGTATDTASLVVARSGAAESGTGSEVASVIQYKTGTAESGTATDVSSTRSAAIAGAAESGTGSDTSTLVAILSVRTESGTGSDTAVVTQYKTGTAESGTGTDASSLAADPREVGFALISEVTVSDYTYDLVISPDGVYIYVLKSGENTVEQITVSSMTVTGTASLGAAHDPQAIAISSDGSYVYVGCSLTDTVEKIRTSDMTVVGTTSLTSGDNPVNLALSPDDAYVYASLGVHTVKKIRTSDMVVTGTATLIAQAQPYGLCLSSDGAYAYVVDYRAGYVEKIRTSDMTVVDNVYLAPIYDLSAQQDGIRLSPDGLWLYVAQGDGSLLHEIDIASSFTLARSIDLSPFYDPSGLSFSPDGAYLYVSGRAIAQLTYPGLTFAHVFEKPSTWLNSNALSPDGSWMAASLLSSVLKIATPVPNVLESGTVSDTATQNYPRSSTAESGTGSEASSLVILTMVYAFDSGTSSP